VEGSHQVHRQSQPGKARVNPAQVCSEVQEEACTDNLQHVSKSVTTETEPVYTYAWEAGGMQYLVSKIGTRINRLASQMHLW
jgi:hypothetical protein